MLYKRWWTTHRIRCTGGVCKPLLGAVAKSYGIERKRKGCTSGQVSVKKLNESEPLMTYRKRNLSAKATMSCDGCEDFSRHLTLRAEG